MAQRVIARPIVDDTLFIVQSILLPVERQFNNFSPFNQLKFPQFLQELRRSNKYGNIIPGSL